MIDALGTPQSLLLLGGTSEIGLAVVERYLARRPLRVVLAARPSGRRDAAAARLQNQGATVQPVDFDAADAESHPQVLEEAWRGGDLDLAVVAFGLLGDQERAWRDHAAAVELARVNYVGAVSVGVLLGQRMREQGHGAVVALSSVAGERVRRSTFVYGSTKAGMDGFYLGLGEALAPSGVHVLVVRPGFVRTRMTAGLPAAPLAVGAPDVADSVVEGLERRREVVWVPTAMRPVMAGLRHVPRRVFRRLPIR